MSLLQGHDLALLAVEQARRDLLDLGGDDLIDSVLVVGNALHRDAAALGDDFIRCGGQQVVRRVGQPGALKQLRRCVRAGDGQFLHCAVRRDRHRIGAQDVQPLPVLGLGPDSFVVLAQRRRAGLLQNGSQIGGCRQNAHGIAVGIDDGGKVQRRPGKRDGRCQRCRPAQQCPPLRARQRRPAADMLSCFYG